VALDRYRAGLAGYLEVLNAADTMTSAQRQLADIRSRTFSLDVALVRALGGGFQARVPSVNDDSHLNKQS
jgi:outer membrane protein TolC